MKNIIFITILSLTFYSCIESTYVYNNTVKVDKEIEDVFTKYVQYWSEEIMIKINRQSLCCSYGCLSSRFDYSFKFKG